MARDRIITGIDIGSAKICTIISQISPEGKISVIGVSTVISKGIKKGVVVDIDEAVEAIAASLEGAERMAGYAVSGAFITVDGSHITSLNSKGVVAVSHQEGEITESDVRLATDAAQAISIPSNQEIIHVIPRGFSVDSQEGVKDPIGMSGIRLEVETNIIYGSAMVMRNLVKCVERVGVDVQDLIYGGLASSESVLNDTEKELGTVLVDLGGGTTDVAIFLSGSPVYASALPIGGQNITNDLAIGLRISLEEAEKIKIKLSRRGSDLPVHSRSLNELPGPVEDSGGRLSDEIDISDLGLEMKTLSRKLTNDIIRARLVEIISLVALEIKKSGLAGKLPGGLVLTGGSAEIYGAIEAFKTILKMPVRVGYPGGVTGLIEEIGGPAYSASLGLITFGSRLSNSNSSGAAKGKLNNLTKKFTAWVQSLLP